MANVRQGHCPVCNELLEYDQSTVAWSNVYDKGVMIDTHCECGWTGQEHYWAEFGGYVSDDPVKYPEEYI